MPFFSDEIGDLDDRVRLRMNGEEILFAESWDVVESVLSQPAAWAMQIGSGDVAATLLKKYPPRTPFQLYIGNALQATGRTDGRSAQSNAGATTVTLRGRDALAPLHDGFVTKELSFNDATYSALVRDALKQVGIDPNLLRPSNAANRRLKTGISITELGPPKVILEILAEFGHGHDVGSSIGIVRQTLQAKLGERWHEFVRRHLDRAGLFLWAAADGTFVLSAPNTNQKPSYRLVRRRGERFDGVNVTSVEFVDEATHRFSEVVIYGKGGGGKFGRTKSKGAFVDSEMVAYGYSQALVLKDANVKNHQQAAFLARRKIAESLREGYHLTYEIAGMTLPAIGFGGRTRAVVTPDTTIDVDDDELGISGTFYVEGVRRVRNPSTSTTIRLMRTQDLVFGEEA